ncbi:MAG: Cof-type HAD-IIB family hydrolase [Oscillospiraceae bacterium]|nr:Cof-type HAD-IIB family hydrolase [Oscillospiraceae bacterium]
MKNKTKIKLIVTDLDGTLLRRNETVSEYTLDVFRRVRECGILFVFATARSLEGSREYRELLNPDGDIVTGGCLVYARGQLLRNCDLPEARTAALLAELCSNPAVTRVAARSMGAVYSNTPEKNRVFFDFRSGLPERLLHASCRTDDSQFLSSLAARYPEFLFFHSSGSDFYDINPKEATKLNGVKVLAGHFNVPLTEVAAFGDDNSDVGMLGECGFGVAMGNAIKACKAAAGYICGDCDGDGAAKWLEEKILL